MRSPIIMYLKVPYLVSSAAGFLVFDTWRRALHSDPTDRTFRIESLCLIFLLLLDMSDLISARLKQHM